MWWGRWRGKEGRGDRNRWRLNECDSESNGGNEKEDGAVAEKILKNWRESWMVLEGGREGGGHIKERER